MKGLKWNALFFDTENTLLSMPLKMFYNFTFFEIKNAWGLIRSDLGHNEEIKKIFFDYFLF